MHYQKFARQEACILCTPIEVGFGKGASGMMDHLRDVYPEGWANPNPNTTNAKAGNNEAQPVVSQGAKKLLS